MRIDMAVAWVEYVKEKWRACTWVPQRQISRDFSNSDIEPTAEQYFSLGSVGHGSWQEEKKHNTPQSAHVSDSSFTGWTLRD
jgi:hypothetical protein